MPGISFRFPTQQCIGVTFGSVLTRIIRNKRALQNALLDEGKAPIRGVCGSSSSTICTIYPEHKCKLFRKISDFQKTVVNLYNLICNN